MRADLEIIREWIKPESNILDLGCGDGELLDYLVNQKGAKGYGIENDHTNITRCIERGVSVIEKNIDQGLASIPDNRFDTVVMTQAIQVMHRPDQTLDEMLRIGKECIVTFPNFGHWRTRTYLAFRGKMPVSKFLSYSWYDTPNIHFCTFKDFERLCLDKDIQIMNRTVVDNDHRQRWWNALWPNLFGEVAIYRITR